MDVYRSEEEQLAALKRWWDDNQKFIFAAVALALVTFGGWKWYQKYTNDQAMAAAGLYQSVMKSVQEISSAGAADVGKVADADARMKKAVDQLVAEHAGTTYTRYAAMLYASNAVAKDDYSTAEKYLHIAADGTSDRGLAAVAENRLARVLAAEGKYDDALKVIVGAVPDELVAVRAETRGDILLAKGSRAEARKAYEEAKAATKEAAPNPLLAMKLDYVAGE